MIAVNELPLSLPVVVLKEIFRHISTPEILQSSRLVSKSWNQYSNSICRARQIKVKPVGDFNSVSDYCIHDVFTRDADLPWSAVNLSFTGSTYNCDSQKFCDQISEGFGDHVQFLCAQVHASVYGNFFRALSSMANLKKLEVTLSSDGNSTVLPFPASLIQLPKLRSLKIVHSSNSKFVDLLEMLLYNTGSVLDSLELNISDFNETEFELKRMAEAIYAATTRNWKVSLEIAYKNSQCAGWNFLVNQGYFAISHLRLHLELCFENIQDAGYRFNQLELFLKKCVGLKVLHLIDFDVPSKESTPISHLLRFPKLLHLKELKIAVATYFCYRGVPYNPDPEFPYLYFNLLTSNNFPSLETVQLTSGCDIRKIFDPSTPPFENVKTLCLSEHQTGEGKLSAIFPKVTKIRAIVQEHSQLGSILEGMEHIAELDLTVSAALHNCNQLLNTSCDFIQPLKNLKKLTLRSLGGYRTNLNASGLTVLQMLPPLNLVIYGSEIQETDPCISLLRAAHPRLQLL